MFMLCAILAATTLCTAQVKREEKAFCKEKCTEMTRRVTERMKKELSLTDEQTAQVEALNKEYLPKMRNCHTQMHKARKGCPGAKDCPKAKECKKQATDCPGAKDCPKAKECKKQATDCPGAKDCPKAKECKKACPNKGGEMCDKRKEEIHKARKEYKEKLNAILTPEQQEKQKALQNERREKRKPKK